ncbi:hypothetical protein G6F31_018968 [Rhizopus arrhizus]|nr:hypothetical protein G6F31_018968 [Rhizopus arrhizus]
MLFDSSEEGGTSCLGLFPGVVRRFSGPRFADLIAADDEACLADTGAAGAVDTRPRLLQTTGTVGQGVAQRVQCRHVLRVGHQDLAQVSLGTRNVVTTLPGERTGVQQPVVIRVGGQAAGQRV